MIGRAPFHNTIRTARAYALGGQFCYTCGNHMIGGFAPMDKTLIAEATVTINAPAARVWEALTNAKLIKQYLFERKAISDWEDRQPHHLQGHLPGSGV